MAIDKYNCHDDGDGNRNHRHHDNNDDDAVGHGECDDGGRGDVF